MSYPAPLTLHFYSERTGECAVLGTLSKATGVSAMEYVSRASGHKLLPRTSSDPQSRSLPVFAGKTESLPVSAERLNHFPFSWLHKACLGRVEVITIRLSCADHGGVESGGNHVSWNFEGERKENQEKRLPMFNWWETWSWSVLCM